MPRDINKRKILMVLESCYPTEGGGGAENQVRTISRYLHQRGIPVKIITPMTREGPQVEHDHVDGVPVWRIPYPQVRMLGGLLMLGRLTSYLFVHRNEYDVIHAHIAHNMAAVSSAVGRVLGKIVLVKLTGWLEFQHGVLARGRNPVMGLKRAALRTANYIQATSSQIRNRLIERGFRPEQVRVIPNAVDIRRFALARGTAGQTEKRPLTLVYVGRLVPEKGLGTLLDAWERAFDVGDDAQLLMIGHGALREAIDTRVQESGRSGQVKLLGPRSDIEKHLVNADVGVLPSLYEGLSNTLLEYMAAGLPVLGTRVSGTEDFVEPGVSGWLVDAEDTDAMTARLREIRDLDREQLEKMGDASRQRVTLRAGIDAVMAKLAELYEIRAALASAQARECT